MKNNIRLLIDQSPWEIYQKIYDTRYIPITKKIEIIKACLNDQKIIDLNKYDPNGRSFRLERAADSLDKAIEKNKKK